MKARVFNRTPLTSLLITVAPLLVAAVFIGLVFAGITQTREANRQEGVRLLHEAISRVAVHSYAVNGYFPESLDYIVETYGIHVDTRRFHVDFRSESPNMLPFIDVWAR